jgi:type IV secretion system protein VirB10
MSERPDLHEEEEPGSANDGNSIAPLPGEPGIPDVSQRTSRPVSKKGLLAVGLLVASLVAVSASSIQRFVSSGKQSNDGDSKRVGDRPTSATSDPRRLDMTVAVPASAPASAGTPRIPALVPTPQEAADPIGVRRTGQVAPAPGGAKPALPEDAPVLLLSTRPNAVALAKPNGAGRITPASEPPAEGRDPREPDSSDPLTATTRNLQGYQQQLQGMLDTLTRSTSMAASQATGPFSSGTTTSEPPSTGVVSSNAGTQAGGLFGGQLQGSATPRVVASMLGNRSLTLPKGTAFTCALKTKIISATSGFVGCQVQRNVFSDDGRVLLVERGSHMDGEYRIASMRPGTVRVPVLWTRIRTPNGVTVDIDSPGTGQLGESGIEGYVDNRWFERIGAAMLLSLIDDSVKLVIQNQANETQGNTVVLPSTTANTSKLAEKVLDSTINIPPLIYQNQGGIVGIYVARDVDFSSVYELKPVAR